jgi:hypothetical protein
MSTNETAVEYSELCLLLRQRFHELGEKASLNAVARTLGYINPKTVALFLEGDANLPLDKVPAMARALDLEPSHLFRLALRQYWSDPAEASTITRCLVSADELAILDLLRSITGEAELALTPELDGRIRSAFPEKCEAPALPT